MKLSIIIPVYNEVNTILEIVRRVQQEPHEKEIIIIDDGSTDGTVELLNIIEDLNPKVRSLPEAGLGVSERQKNIPSLGSADVSKLAAGFFTIKIIYNPENKGKGFCLRRGFAEASGDIVIIQDADLEYYPAEYGNLIQKIEEGLADVVFGSRFLGAHRVFYFYNYVGNILINLFANGILNTNLTDCMTCYKAFRKNALEKLLLSANGFGIEMEMTSEVFRRRLRVYEVPISYNGRTYEEGKKIKRIDFLRCCFWLLKASLRRLDVGSDTLLKLTSAVNNNRWIFNKIKPFIGSRIIEFGAGIGTISKFIVGPKRSVTLTDINNNYIEYLKERFGWNPHVNILKMDANNIDETAFGEKFDTVVAINILEHLENDSNVLRSLKKIMVPGGKLILVVPAHGILFSEFDKKLGHFRRYSRADLSKKLVDNGYDIEILKHFNFLSAIGWFFSFKFFKSRRMPITQVILADRTIPLIGFIEKYFQFPFGLSLFCVALAP
jgi:glycosyltransferase involved in cell wall biosynthesis